MSINTFLKSFDNKEIIVREWLPDGNVKFVMQIVHGMAEHSLRYSEFAEFLNKRGMAVYSHDLRGHGFTVKNNNQLGIMNRKFVLKDIEIVAHYAKDRHQLIPFVMIGHSMGSLLIREFLMNTKIKIDKAIISGTPGPSGVKERTGLLLALWEQLIHSRNGKSQLMWNMTFGDYNRHFEPNRTMFDWLSRDFDEVDKYEKDPLCGFVCAAEYYVDLIRSVIRLSNISLNPVNKETDLFFIAGDRDPVCDFGKGAMKIANRFKSAGYNNIKTKIYENHRHELLHEIDRINIFNDINDWILLQ